MTLTQDEKRRSSDAPIQFTVGMLLLLCGYGGGVVFAVKMEWTLAIICLVALIAGVAIIVHMEYGEKKDQELPR